MPGLAACEYCCGTLMYTRRFGWRRCETVRWPGTAGAGIDQVPDIGIARGDHAVEGRVDFLERLQLLEAFHIRLCGRHHGFLGRSKSPWALSTSCFDTESVFRRSSISRRGDLGQTIVRLGRIQIRARLIELLIHFRCFYFREQLARLSRVRRCPHTTSSDIHSCGHKSVNP